jgi:hypothetical protein
MVTTTRARPARYWAVLLVVLALAACTTGLARPAAAAPMAMPAMAGAMTEMPVPAAATGNRAEAACPMAGMDCTPSAHHQRHPTAALQAAAHGSPGAVTGAGTRSALGGATSGSRRGEPPDLHHMCVSRT